MSKVAAIDIGSNAIRLVVADIDTSGKIQTYRKLREPVRLGNDVFEKSKTISVDSIASALKAFEKFKKVLEELKISVVRAVATSAVREAVNGQEFVEILAKAHKIQVSVIDGIEEARLIQKAILGELDLKGKRSALIDIGGGSVEVTLMEGEKCFFAETFKLGTVRLLKIAESQKLSTSALDKYILENLVPLSRRISEFQKRGPIDFCVGSGGNIDSLGVIRANYFNKNSMTKIYLEELEKILKKLEEMSIKERIEKWDLRPDRADVIFPAGLVVKCVMRLSGAETMLIPRVGLKDGIVRDLLSS